MAPISTKVHGIVDYATGAAMLVAPTLLRIGDRRAAALLCGAGAGTIAASAVTDHELALLRKLPMPLHLLLDGGVGLTLAVVPWAVRRQRSGLAATVIPWAERRRRADLRDWVPHAAVGIGEIALAALTERRPAASVAPAAPSAASAAPDRQPDARPARRPDPRSESQQVDWTRVLPPDPNEPPGDDADTLVAREASAAAAEAAMIGGAVPPEVGDPALDPVYQAGGGEQEGWEAAEAELIENATHGDGAGDPLRDAISPEVESDRSGAVYGEGDRIFSTEVVADPGSGPDDPAAGPGLAAEREPRPDPGQTP
jgi:hypothetical protein